ncbi:MAG: hypothetical protein RIG61_01550 [Deltaproteobacteria bacterium]
MAHEVSFTIPSRALGRSDVEFDVWQKGEKLGTLNVSKGSVVWFPANTIYGYKVGWNRFDKIMQQHAKGFEKR